jgi:hypothetical protein
LIDVTCPPHPGASVAATDHHVIIIIIICMCVYVQGSRQHRRARQRRGLPLLQVVFEECGIKGGVQMTLLPYAIVGLVVYVVGYPFIVFASL